MNRPTKQTAKRSQKPPSPTKNKSPIKQTKQLFTTKRCLPSSASLVKDKALPSIKSPFNKIKQPSAITQAAAAFGSFPSPLAFSSHQFQTQQQMVTKLFTATTFSPIQMIPPSFVTQRSHFASKAGPPPTTSPKSAKQQSKASTPPKTEANPQTPPKAAPPQPKAAPKTAPPQPKATPKTEPQTQSESPLAEPAPIPSAPDSDSDSTATKTVVASPALRVAASQPVNHQPNKVHQKIKVRTLLTELDQIEFKLVSWDAEEENQTKLLLDSVNNPNEEANIFGHLLELADEDFKSIPPQEFNFDPDFQPDPQSTFHPYIQQLPFYRMLPKALKHFRPDEPLPDDFDPTQFVLENIHRFPDYPKTPLSPEAILAGYHDVRFTKELGDFMVAFRYDTFARSYGLNYIGSDDYTKSMIAQRVCRQQRDLNEARNLDMRTELRMTDEQIDALDSVLAFTLPRLTQQQTDQMMIHHLKKKAAALTAEYNNDPFMRAHIEQRYGLQSQLELVEDEKVTISKEKFKMKQFVQMKEREFAERQLETMDEGSKSAFEREVAEFNAEKDQRMKELDESLALLQAEHKKLSSQRRELEDHKVLSPNVLNVIAKLPVTDKRTHEPGITVDNVQKAQSVLGDTPLSHNRADLDPKTGKLKPKQIETSPGGVQQSGVPSVNPKKLSLGKKIALHYELTKPRISQMVGATSLWGYLAVGNPTNWTDLGLLTAGTIALSSSASIANQIRETDVDAKMTRTMSRPLVTGAISLASAKKQAALYAAMGSAMLMPLHTLVPILGLSNIALYGGLYTSLKRTTALNTEVGAVVGAIPPMMGYFAALTATQSWDHSLTALCFPAAMMISWQIQHVMLICARRGDDYNRSGLVMQCKDDPGLKKTINKGIAWSVISTIVSSIPFFTGYADLTQLFTTYLWAVYTIPYAMAMKKQDHKRLGNVLLAGYVVLGLTILLSVMARIPADNLGYLITEGPLTPSALPEQPPTLFEVLFKGAGKPIVPTNPSDLAALDQASVAGTSDAQIQHSKQLHDDAKAQLEQLTQQIVASDPDAISSQDKDV